MPKACDLHWATVCILSLPQGSGLHVTAALAEAVQEAGDRCYRVRDSGLDAIEFLLAAGPAEPLRPLAAVASGGESARIMMALKAAPAAAAIAAAGDVAGVLVYFMLINKTVNQAACPEGQR